MQKIFSKTITAMSLAALMAFGGCTDGDKFTTDVSTSQSTINVNKRGLDYNGGEITIDIKANTYWVINYDEEAVDWIEVSPKAAFGDNIVTVNVNPNTGDERSVTLYFDTQDGVKTEVNLYQSAFGEILSYYNEDFGGEPVSAPVSVEEFDGWGVNGFGSGMVTYSGTASISAAGEPSSYEGASGGNALLFTEDGTTLELGPVETRGDIYFRLSAGVCNSAGAFAADGITITASLDGEDWYPFTYTAPATASGWGTISAMFHVIDVERMYLKITGKAGYMLDDIIITEGSESDNGYELEFSLDGDDNNKVGYSYFSDYFDWVTYEFGGTDYMANPQLNTAETRFDVVYTLTPDLIEIFENAGWKQIDNERPVYLRLGYLKLARSKCAGAVQSPAFTNIREGRTIHTQLYFKAAMYEATNGTRDLDNIRIEVTGGGTINSATKTEIEFPVGVYGQWPEEPFVVNIYNATHQTQVTFKTAYSTEALTAAGASNRFFLDEVELKKISKSTEIEEEWAETLATPQISTSNVSASATSVAASWEAVPHAFRYEYKVSRTDDGSIVRQDITNSTACAVNGLATGVQYEISVRALGHEESLRYQPSDWTDPVNITTVDKDVHPFGYVFFEDDFSWIDEEFGSGVSGWTNGFTDLAWQYIVDGSQYCPAEAVALWNEKGYTLTNRSYANFGNLKIGRTVNDDKNVGDHTGTITLPVSALADITPDAAISVKVEFDASFYSATDTHVITIECSNGEKHDVALENTTTFTWESHSVVFNNVTNLSTVTFATYEQQKNTPNRIYLDNFRISKYNPSEGQ